MCEGLWQFGMIKRFRLQRPHQATCFYQVFAGRVTRLLKMPLPRFSFRSLLSFRRFKMHDNTRKALNQRIMNLVSKTLTLLHNASSPLGNCQLVTRLLQLL